MLVLWKETEMSGSDLFIVSEMDELHKILDAVNERLRIVAMSVANSKKPTKLICPYTDLVGGCIKKVGHKPCTCTLKGGKCDR